MPSRVFALQSRQYFCVLGMLFGAGTYVALFPKLQPVFESMSDWGKVTLPQITGTSPWVWIVALAVVIGIALVLLERRHPQPQNQSLLWPSFLNAF